MTRSSQRQLSPQASDPNTSNRSVSQKHAQSNGTGTQASATMREVENSERPVREKLKNTSIATATAQEPQSPSTINSDTAMANDESTKLSDSTIEKGPTENNSLKKKRSFEDVEAADSSQDRSAHPEKHVRKRSRSREPEKSEDAISKDSEEQPYGSGTDALVEHTAANGSEEVQMVQAERSSTPAAETDAMIEDNKDSLTSPKNKRSREEFLEDHAQDKVGSSRGHEKEKATSGTDVKKPAGDKGTPSGEPKSKRHRDSNSPQPDDAHQETEAETKVSTTKVPPSDGFANTSTVSPFSSLAAQKSSSEQPQTSNGAFEKSGFSSFVTSSSSPFAKAGASTSEGSKSPFSATAGDKGPLSVFGSGKPISSLSASSENKGFGSVSSGGKASFGTAGPSGMSGSGNEASGFGRLGGGLSDFSSKPGSTTFGPSKGTPTFGAPTEDDEDNEAAEEDAEGDDTPAVKEGDKQDERFHVQDVNTGEDDESTRFQSRARLYAFMAKEGSKEKAWIERGSGNIKLNISKPDDEKPNEPPKVRLIMRASGSQRVVLNTPVLKDISFGDAKGGKPKDPTILFRGTIDDKPELELLQLKMTAANVLELWQQISELQEDM